VKIVEVSVTPEGIFAKAVPYQDVKLTAEERKFNVKGELDLIQSLITSIRKSTSYDKIDLFEEVEMALFAKTEQPKPVELNRVVFKCAISIAKMLSNQLRQSPNEFIQTLLEARSYIARLLLVRK
jgi:predicted restriction endonuclease